MPFVKGAWKEEIPERHTAPICNITIHNPGNLTPEEIAQSIHSIYLTRAKNQMEHKLNTILNNKKPEPHRIGFFRRVKEFLKSGQTKITEVFR